MNKIKNSFNSYPIDMLAQLGALEAIKDTEYLKQTCNKIIFTRQRVAEQLKNLGFMVLPSKANFLFIIHKEKRAEDIFKKLREKKILVRYFKKPRLDNGLRVTIGTDEQMDIFIKEIKEIIKEQRRL